MKYIVFLLLFIICSNSFAQDTTVFKPINYKKWQGKSNDRKRAGLFGGSIKNYNVSDSTWARIENNWIVDGDSVIIADKAVLKTRVRYNGESSVDIDYEGSTYTITQKMVGLYFFRSTDTARLAIDKTPNYSRRSVDSNIISWKNVFPQVDYQVIKSDGRLEHRIFFKPLFLDSAVVLYDARSDTDFIYLSNVMEYTLSGNIDESNKEMVNINKRIFKKLGKYVFKLQRQQLFYDGWANDAVVKVRQDWIKRKNKWYCVESIKMSDIKRIHNNNPTDTLWHNTSQTFDASEIVDGYFRGATAPNASFYIATNFVYLSRPDFDRANTWRVGGLSTITSGSTIDSTHMHVIMINTAEDSILLHKMTVFWDTLANTNNNELQVGDHGPTRSKAKDSLSIPGDISWTGLNFSASDFDDNGGSGFGRLDSPADTIGMNGYSGEQSGSNISQTIRDWTDGTQFNWGWRLESFGRNVNITFRPADVTLPILEPFLFVEWTVPSVTSQIIIIE